MELNLTTVKYICISIYIFQLAEERWNNLLVYYNASELIKDLNWYVSFACLRKIN